MEPESFSAINRPLGDTFSETLARHLFDCGASAATFYSNEIILEVPDWEHAQQRLESAVRAFFVHYSSET